jgi:ribosomal protein L11 methyltransferase
VYTDAPGLATIRAVFDDVKAEPVAPGWEDAWRRFHVPAVVGGLWIGPPWHDAPPGLTPIVIDPGRAFGTGAHETTRLCLELLLGIRGEGSFLDIGCGSGVLAIAAAKLGYGPVTAVDIDEAAVDAAARNAAANGVAVEVHLRDAASDTLPAVDVAAANVTLKGVEAAGRRVDTGHLIASGYLVADEPRLPGFRHVERRAGDRFAADLYARQ